MSDFPNDDPERDRLTAAYNTALANKDAIAAQIASDALYKHLHGKQWEEIREELGW